MQEEKVAALIDGIASIMCVFNSKTIKIFNELIAGIAFAHRPQHAKRRLVDSIEIVAGLVVLTGYNIYPVRHPGVCNEKKLILYHVWNVGPMKDVATDYDRTLALYGFCHDKVHVLELCRPPVFVDSASRAVAA
jgi:hypothetical protein